LLRERAATSRVRGARPRPVRPQPAGICGPAAIRVPGGRPGPARDAHRPGMQLLGPDPGGPWSTESESRSPCGLGGLWRRRWGDGVNWNGATRCCRPVVDKVLASHSTLTIPLSSHLRRALVSGGSAVQIRLSASERLLHMHLSGMKVNPSTVIVAPLGFNKFLYL
jgi:hypothetical protein